MPTVLRIGPYRFSFYGSDETEPSHVHVKRDRSEAKFWIEPSVRLAIQKGFAAHEINNLMKLVTEHREFLLEKWREHFGQ